jgi:mRNA-degrading endonuclease toxin of MazEF toxin-antitoxin module
MNQGHSGRVIVCPLTDHPARTPLHVEILTGEAGLDRLTSVLVEQIRAVSLQRLDPAALGRVKSATLARVMANLKRMLNL